MSRKNPYRIGLHPCEALAPFYVTIYIDGGSAGPQIQIPIGDLPLLAEAIRVWLTPIELPPNLSGAFCNACKCGKSEGNSDEQV